MADRQTTGIQDLVVRHLARYPRMEVADLYKLLHQVALGPAHFVRGDDAHARLAAEVAGLGPGPVEPLVDVLSPDGRLARVHLRPYIARGLDVGTLAEAFAATANQFRGSPARLAGFADDLAALAVQGAIPIDPDDLSTFFQARAADGWPAVHHSATYRALYVPAYRLTFVDLLPGCLA